MMKKLVLFDPSYATFNLGDQIINEAIMDEMSFVFDQNFLLRVSSHTPLIHHYQMTIPRSFLGYIRNADLKFIGGSNILKTNLLTLKPDWNINPISASLYAGSIAIGCGMGGTGDIKNMYTKYILKKALSDHMVHSVRDQRTAEILESLGKQAINTGCPTMWMLDRKHCSGIPTNRSSKVVFTVTDYDKDPLADGKILDILLNNYEEVYVWLQGSKDYDYLSELGYNERVTFIDPSLRAYEHILETEHVDYVGTRLHAGIFAMRHSRRSIVCAVDHRALDIQETHGINAIPRQDTSELIRMLNSTLKTEVRVDQESIQSWKAQYLKA